jgi:hypothetical protein
MRLGRIRIKMLYSLKFENPDKNLEINKRCKIVGYLGKMMKVYDKSSSMMTGPSHFPEMECDIWGT